MTLKKAPVRKPTADALEAALRQRTAERDDAYAREAAIAEVQQAINASPGDPMPVFEAMVDKARRLCDADSGHLALPVGGDFRTAAVSAVSPEMEAVIRAVSYAPGRGTAIGRALAERHATQIADIGADAEHAAPHAAARGMIRTVLGVPLLREGEPIGAFGLTRTRVEPFTERQIELVRTFAAQAAIAVENARLLTETRERLEQQTATAEVLAVINESAGNLQPVFEAILERATRLCEAVFGNLYTFDGTAFLPVAAHGLPEFAAWFLRRGTVLPPPGAPLDRIRRGDQVAHILDAADTEAYRTHAGHREVIDRAGIRTWVGVALRNRDELLGGIVVYRREVRPFSDKAIALLRNFAAQAVIAMENARLLGELRRRGEEVAELNRGLEARVAEQVEELGRVGRLKRFLAPQLAELIVSRGDENILESHRREIVVVFCDLRGYTGFTETAEPEEVLDFLREYHGALGPLVGQYEGTLDQFSGDGIMVFFNDPVPIADPADRAVQMAVGMREAAARLTAAWRRRGRALGFGIGIAQGYATLGQIGFAERSGYTAIGTVCNVAARLCGEAKDGQILLSQRVAAGLSGNVGLEEVGPLALKGLTRPIVAYNLPLPAGATSLRVIEGGPSGA